MISPQLRPIDSRAVCVCTWLVLVAMTAGCEALVTAPHNHEIANLSGADRIEITFVGRWNSQTNTFDTPKPIQIADRERVKAVATFVTRYRDGWTTILSGSPAQRHLVFYERDRRLAEIGVLAGGITDGSSGRHLPPDEVSELVSLLGADWPPFDDPKRPSPATSR